MLANKALIGRLSNVRKQYVDRISDFLELQHWERQGCKSHISGTQSSCDTEKTFSSVPEMQHCKILAANEHKTVW